jgi:S1-C subfamily serine protease
VVSIVISKDVPKLEVQYVNPFGDDPLFQNFNVQVPVYRQNGTQFQKVGAGSGFIVRANGYIVTNRHVVDDTTATYTVLLSNGTQKNASVVWKDDKHDLAIVKISGTDLTVLPLGDSSSLELGQSVFAIGNALGEYSNSVSVGIISGLDRTIQAQTNNGVENLTGVIQTDAAINPCNSGGPLVDLNGEAVGVNVAMVQGSQNVGFSIPISQVRTALNKLGI